MKEKNVRNAFTTFNWFHINVCLSAELHLHRGPNDSRRSFIVRLQNEYQVHTEVAHQQWSDYDWCIVNRYGEKTIIMSEHWLVAWSILICLLKEYLIALINYIFAQINGWKLEIKLAAFRLHICLVALQYIYSFTKRKVYTIFQRFLCNYSNCMYNKRQFYLYYPHFKSSFIHFKWLELHIVCAPSSSHFDLRKLLWGAFDNYTIESKDEARSCEEELICLQITEQQINSIEFVLLICVVLHHVFGFFQKCSCVQIVKLKQRIS